MNLQDVKSKGTALRRSRRVGRGPGSGRGCTAGRGNKGQGSRSGVGGGLAHEGGQMPLFRRLPKRGFTNAPFKEAACAIVNVGELAEAFPDGGQVDLAVAKSRKLVKRKAVGLKLLGNGELDVKLSVTVDRISASARAKIEAAGGSVELLPAKVKALPRKPKAKAAPKAAAAAAPAAPTEASTDAPDSGEGDGKDA